MARKEEWRNKDEKLYSSLYEALVAGIYLDGGLSPARKFITSTIIADYERKKKKNLQTSAKTDYKNKFQEFVQKNKLGSISYQTLSKKGPDHAPEFRVAAMLNGSKIAEGVGPSKKFAESVAAERALKKISKDGKAK